MISAIIFDLDGTIIKDEDVYGKAFGEVLKSLGVKSVPDYPHVGGVGVLENWPILIEKYKIKTNKTDQFLADETQKAYLRHLSEVKVKKGFKTLLEDLSERKILTALATSNEWPVVEEVLRVFGLEKAFDIVTTGEEVIYKKPNPELFTITAEKLGVKPSETLVFEDAESGIVAARNAGMRVVGIGRNESQCKLLGKSGAERVYENFDEIDLSELLTPSSN